jgi:hypothetical protein
MVTPGVSSAGTGWGLPTIYDPSRSVQVRAPLPAQAASFRSWRPSGASGPDSGHPEVCTCGARKMSSTALRRANGAEEPSSRAWLRGTVYVSRSAFATTLFTYSRFPHRPVMMSTSARLMSGLVFCSSVGGRVLYAPGVRRTRRMTGAHEMRCCWPGRLRLRPTAAGCCERCAQIAASCA